MTIEAMVLSELDASKDGVVYNMTYALSGAETSDALSIPEVCVDDIAIQYETTGEVNIYATAGTPAQIAADTNIWDLWDGSSAFNKALTAFYVDNISGDATVCVSVRGR